MLCRCAAPAGKVCMALKDAEMIRPSIEYSVTLLDTRRVSTISGKELSESAVAVLTSVLM